MTALAAERRSMPPVPEAARPGLEALLWSMADDELVIGFSDSEWTGIAPQLEEDIAMSSLAQDELGHAAALYGLLAGLRVDGGDADSLAYDRESTDYRHARLLDHGRGDWAMTIARRFLYETADAVRLEALVGGSWPPLAELVAKLQREERYHGLHVAVWMERLAGAGGTARERLTAALSALGTEGGTVFTPLPGEPALLAAGIATRSIADKVRDWRQDVEPVLRSLDLPVPDELGPDALAAGRGPAHGPAFAWLHGEFTSVRRSDPGATW